MYICIMLILLVLRFLFNNYHWYCVLRGNKLESLMCFFSVAHSVLYVANSELGISYHAFTVLSNSVCIPMSNIPHFAWILCKISSAYMCTAFGFSIVGWPQGIVGWLLYSCLCYNTNNFSSLMWQVFSLVCFAVILVVKVLLSRHVLPKY